ncbi:MAG: UrcA family protein [Phenylobacterium sp.]
MRAIIISGLLAAGLAGPAFAYDQKNSPEGDQVRVVAVSKAGVDFADGQKVGRLYARLKRAANLACSTESADHHLARPDQACVSQALAQAVRGADKPLLTAAYQADATAGERAFAGNDQ